MAVILKKKEIIGRQEIRLRVFLPKGRLSKEEKERARKLDEYLNKRMPQILLEMRKESLLKKSALEKWHGLGRKLAFIYDESLVNPQDISNGYIWLAIRQHCPLELLPRGTKSSESGATTGARREGKKYDHLDYCYRCGKYSWEDINWVGDWFNWITLVESPGLIRDPRVVPIMGKIARSTGHSLTKKEFRAFAKALRQFFSTKQEYRDTSGIDKAKIEEVIIQAARDAGLIK